MTINETEQITGASQRSDEKPNGIIKIITYLTLVILRNACSQTVKKLVKRLITFLPKPKLILDIQVPLKMSDRLTILFVV